MPIMIEANEGMLDFCYKKILTRISSDVVFTSFYKDESLNLGLLKRNPMALLINMSYVYWWAHVMFFTFRHL